MSTTFVSGIDGDPIYAKRSEEDQYGNNIERIYAKKTDIPDDTELKFTDMVVFGYPSFSGSVPTQLTNYSYFVYNTKKIAGHKIRVVYQNRNPDQGPQYPQITAHDESGKQIFFQNWLAPYGTTTIDARIPSGAVKMTITVQKYCRASFTWTCIDPINDRVASITSSDNSVNVSMSGGVADLMLPGNVVRDSNYTHIDAATASPLMDGTASVGASGKFAREDHVHPTDTSREAVENKTTVVQGSSDSKYPTDKAVWNFVNSSIATNTAYYISDNGEPFTSVEELEAYPGIVTNNDYAFVTGTDSAGNTYYDRYKATVRDSTVTWALEYRLNNSSFTAAQWAAINSGITAALVAKIHEHSNKAVLDGITATDVSNWNDKLDKDGLGDDVCVQFTQSPTRTNIVTTSKLSVLFGKIQKWFADLGSLAFKDTVGASDVDSGTYNIDIGGNAATADSATTAASATVLANLRNIHVNLESNVGANFNGSANITPGVKGVLPTAFGGTGFSTVDSAPTENSNKMVVSGGVWNFSAPAKLGILTGSSVNVNNDFDNFDRFAVLVTSTVRLRTYWLSKKSGRVIEFYNMNDYEIAVDVVIEIGQTVVFHRQATSDVTWTNSGSTTSAQTLCSLSYKGYVKFYVTYDSTTGQFDIYQNSNFAYLTGNLTTSMIGNVGTSGTKDTKTDVVYHNDIVCNHASGNYAINVERLVIGQMYRFQFLTKTGYTYLYNNGTSNVTVYTGNTSFTLGPGWNANIQASSSAVASHTVSVVRMSATLVYIIWGY